MKKTTLRRILYKFIFTFTIFYFAFTCIGCSGDKVGKNSMITVSGSSALQPLAQEAANMFMKENPNTQINIQGGGSGTGLSQVVSGAVEIGNSDLFAQDKIKEQDILGKLVDHKVAVAGFAMVVNSKVSVDSLTKEQIQGIFTGEISNWKEVGGEDLKIEVINRGKSSGTRLSFINKIMDGKREANNIGTIQDSSGAVQKAISKTEGSVSYLSLSYFTNEDAKKGLKLLKINNINPSVENIVNQKYPFWSYEHMYTKGEAKGVSEEFINYMLSEEMKFVIKNKGYIPISEMKINI